MVQRVNGGFVAGERLTGNMDFFTVHVLAELEEGAWGAEESATRNLIKLVEAISTGAQPILTSLTSEVVDLSVSANATFYGFGSTFDEAGTTVYTLKFAVEHTGVFGSEVEAADSTVSYSLAARLNGVVLPFETTVTGETVNVLNTAAGAGKNVTIKAFSLL